MSVESSRPVQTCSNYYLFRRSRVMRTRLISAASGARIVAGESSCSRNAAGARSGQTRRHSELLLRNRDIRPTGPHRRCPLDPRLPLPLLPCRSRVTATVPRAAGGQRASRCRNATMRHPIALLRRNVTILRRSETHATRQSIAAARRGIRPSQRPPIRPSSGRSGGSDSKMTAGTARAIAVVTATRARRPPPPPRRRPHIRPRPPQTQRHHHHRRRCHRHCSSGSSGSRGAGDPSLRHRGGACGGSASGGGGPGATRRRTPLPRCSPRTRRSLPR
jgi:hypothetical protein